MDPKKRIGRWEEGEEIGSYTEPEIIVKEDKIKGIKPEKQIISKQTLEKQAKELQKERIKLYKLKKRQSKIFEDIKLKKISSKEIKHLAPTFSEMVGGGMANANFAAANEQGGIISKRFIDTMDEDPLVPKFTFPEFGVPDFTARKPKYYKSLVNTSNGVIPTFGSPSFSLPVFKMPSFAPNENIFKRRTYNGKKKKR